ncbi:MAG: amino acid adenylation domain-containing protein [Verrucomicrobiae bacterium]
MNSLPQDSIAIVGMAGRFPGAGGVPELWENLLNGVDAISHFTPEEIEASVASPEAVARGEKFVRARGVIGDAAMFDAEFFEIPPREAELMDPQHRIFLECAWEALESAGHDPHSFPGAISIYAGLSLNTYLLNNLCGGNDFSRRLATNYQVGEYSAMLGNDKDFLPTRVAYKLNLRGPAMAVQCACSTSLVAIAQACTSLQTYQSDMALAGGVSVTFPQKRDYRYEEEGMVSPDGVCRPFDADARGTVFSHGAAVVLLKRLADAEADGNTILAVIRGAAVNNDGADKIGYAAPGLNAQAGVIALAQATAGIEPSTISYVEAHGTGTLLGDPIEFAALTKAFREGGATGNGFCALGSAKGHLGHLDVASGATGLIKTVLQLRHETILPILHFAKPNPHIDFSGSPFYPVTKAIPWRRGETPRRAGVTAAGVGGTNAHVVVEEAPAASPTTASPGPHVLVLSARTATALHKMAANLADHLAANPSMDLADVAFTLATGRRPFAHRRAVVAADRDSAVASLRAEAEAPENDLARTWIGGGMPDWSAHFAGQTRRRVPLPTYPFERKNYWVGPGTVSEPVGPEPESMGEPVEDLVGDVRRMFKELSGVDVDNEEATFEELGFDSLFLTQVSIAVFSRFGVKVTFRQLLGEVPSLASLVARIRREKPVGRPAVAKKQRAGSSLSVVRRPAGGRAAEAPGRFGPYRPMDRGSDGGLTDRQRKALDDLIARYTKRTAASKRYTADHRAHYADPRAVSGFQSLWKEMVYPIVSESSAGSKIRDLDGHSYVDITMGFGAYFFGHSPAWLTGALEAQLRRGIEIGPQSGTAGEIARAVCDLTGMERATFCNTGSEAVMAAIRLARTVTGRSRVVYFTGDYHGMFDEVLVRGAWVDGEYRAQPIAPGIPDSLVENMLVLDWAAPESLEILRAHAHELAAVIVEPVQSRRPGVQPKSFLREVRAITARSDTALIFDEVVTGFRCHPGGAQAYFGVRADMATYGKVIGGGIPIGILAGAAKYLDALDGGAWRYGDGSFPETGMTFFAGTFVRHPLAMAAARAVLDQLYLHGPGLQLRMTERTDLLCRTLDAHFEAVGAPLRAPHFSAFAMIEHAPDLRFVSLLWYYLREKGVHVWENRPIFLTLAHSDEDFDQVVGAFVESVGEMQEAGFLPPAPAGTQSLGVPNAFPRHDSAPMTEAQREILLAVQMGDDANRAFNESIVVDLHGTLDRPALEKAVLHVMQRHPALRSTFRLSEMRQVFEPAPDSFPLPVGGSLENLCREATGTAFDLERGPLVFWRLVPLEAGHHALLFTAHHLVCDGWSIGMIVDELSKSYNAFRAGRLPMLPPPMTFGEYARALHAARKDGAKDREFWLGQFRDGAPTLDLPADRPRPPLKTYSGGLVSRALPRELFKQLQAAAPALGGTLFSTLLASFAVLLRRLGGESDLVVGVPSAGQTLAGCDELVGHCLNFLPLRLRCAEDATFASFSKDVRRVVLDAYEHQSFTFGSLVKELKLPRDPSRLPLVSAMFNIDRSGFDRLRFDGLTFRVKSNPKQFVNFDIFFNVVQSDADLEIECEYNTGLFDAATIRRWLVSFETLIGGILAAPDTGLLELPVLGGAERAVLLSDARTTSRPYDREVPVHALVSKVAAAFPNKTAVISGEKRMTYSELEELSSRLASRLAAAGVGPGDLVGLCIGRSEKMVAGLLGILKTGAAYVPMDPGFPAVRLGFLCEDSRMPVIVAEDSTREVVAGSGAKILLFDEASDPRAFEASPLGGEHPAYVMFTSGSTGRPKGVVIPHRALANFLHSMRREPGLSADDTLLAVTTLSFDISGLEIFLPLTTGATVVIASKEAQADGNLLAAEMKRNSATVMQATPATWRLLLDSGWDGFPRMKILVGGEAVPCELVNRLVPICASVWNVYGPTETTIWSTTGRLERGAGPVLIGHPIDNTRIYIVNSAMRLQPPGVAGEMLIGGDGLALGYLHRDDLTAEKFVPGPSENPERVYRTGDLARRHADGSIECLGRMDDQVKVRGFRIEPGEIEAELEKFPGILQAVAHVHDGRLMAFLRTSSNEDLSAGLRGHLLAALPDYMVPSHFIRLDSIPQTPNGKVDRRALPAPDFSGKKKAGPAVEPATGRERKLLEIWRQVLEIPGIGVEDDIFELGGDSLLIFQISTRATAAGIPIRPAEIFLHRTIASLAAHAGREQQAATPPAIQRLKRDDFRRKA